MPRERFDFANAQGHRLAALIDNPVGEPRAYALLAHCFTCGKDNQAAKRIAEGLTALGIGVLRFDFTGLGASEGEFANTTFSSNVADLVAAADELRRLRRAPEILIGHSLGGAAVLAAAAAVPEARAVVTIAAPNDPAHVAGLFKDRVEEIGERGEVEVSLGGRPFRIRRAFLADVADQKLTEHIASLHKALLVFHSPTDDVVGIENASRIFAAAKHPKSFVSLAGADHLLSRPSDAAYVANVIAAWAERYLDMAPVRLAAAAEPGVVVRETNAGRFQQEIRVGAHRLVARRAGRGRRARQRSRPLRSRARRPRRLHVHDAAALRRAQGAAARAGDGAAHPREDPCRRLRSLRDRGRDDRPDRPHDHARWRARRAATRAAPRDRGQVPGAPHAHIRDRDQDHRAA
jgi:putative redox protein